MNEHPHTNRHDGSQYLLADVVIQRTVIVNCAPIGPTVTLRSTRLEHGVGDAHL